MAEQSNLSKTLDLSAQTGAVALLAAYGAGFVIVSLRQGSLGMLQFDLFKPRLLAAGILFSIFLCLPAKASARSFGLLSFPSSFVTRDSTKHWHLHVLAARSLLLLVSCLVLAVLTTVFFRPRNLDPFEYTRLTIGFGIMICCLLLIRFWALDKTLLCLFLAILGHAVVVFWLYRLDRKSTRLNSSHVAISYAVFCLKNK